jgi:hypothetical protein
VAVSSAANDSLLAFADELERRDVELAAALEAVERVQVEVDEVRVRAAACLAFLASLPGRTSAAAAEEQAARASKHAAGAAFGEADARLERAGSGEARLAAENAVQEARERFDAASRWADEAAAALAHLAEEAAERQAEGRRLESRALRLSARAHGVAFAGGGLEGVSDWASTARGALLLERAALAAEREQIVREANELLAGAIGEPLLSTAVAGLRAKLERAVAQA